MVGTEEVELNFRQGLLGAFGKFTVQRVHQTVIIMDIGRMLDR